MFGLKKPQGFEWFWVVYAAGFWLWNMSYFVSLVKSGEYLSAFFSFILSLLPVALSWFSIWESQHSRARRIEFEKRHEKFMKEMEKRRNGRN